MVDIGRMNAKSSIGPPTSAAKQLSRASSAKLLLGPLRVPWHRLLALVAISSCDSTGDVCVPGAQQACACPGGNSSAQVCNADGTGYEACSCGPGAGGGPGAAGAPEGAAPGVGAGPSNGGAPGVGAGPGSGGGPTNVGGTSSGYGGSEPATCIGAFASFCTSPDPIACTCLGCNATCGESDCVCPVCAADEFCSDGVNCNNDNECDPWAEGCACWDCVDHPECP